MFINLKKENNIRIILMTIQPLKNKPLLVQIPQIRSPKNNINGKAKHKYAVVAETLCFFRFISKYKSIIKIITDNVNATINIDGWFLIFIIYIFHSFNLRHHILVT